MPEDQATASESSAGGTRAGISAWVAGRSKARAAPIAATAANRICARSHPAWLPNERNAIVSPCAPTIAHEISRLSRRSATCPAGSVQRNIGRNWANPIMPRAKVLWVKV
jgi:hypothetical protein